MRRFKVGDRARIVHAIGPERNYFIGKECTILKILTDPHSSKDYEILVDGDTDVAYCSDGILEPIIKTELGSWEEIEELTEWERGKERIREDELCH